MGNKIYLEIEDAKSLYAFLTEAKKRTGLLKDISQEKVKDLVNGKKFPIRIAVSLDSVLDLAGNPIVRKVFGKKLEHTALRFLTSEAKG